MAEEKEPERKKLSLQGNKKQRMRVLQKWLQCGHQPHGSGNCCDMCGTGSIIIAMLAEHWSRPKQKAR